FWILADHIHPASRGLVAGQSVDDLGPRLAAVVRAPYQRDVGVGALVPSGSHPARDVGGVDVAVPRFDGVEGNARAVGNVAHIVPVRAVIHRVVDLSIAADRPEHALPAGRDGKVI